MRDRKIGSLLQNSIVILEPASEDNVDLLIKYTLDPISQGPFKQVPNMTADELKYQILKSRDSWYFLIRRTQDGEPLGRFYYKAWRFQMDPYWIDWELNILIANPSNRGKGYGTTVQSLAAEFLLYFPTTLSVFAYTSAQNIAEQQALKKAGFKQEGLIPVSYYRVPEPHDETLRPCVLYARRREHEKGL
jgi:RimJ/RimL family protein N-acetyltransferase